MIKKKNHNDLISGVNMQTNVLEWLDYTASRYPNKIAIVDENMEISWDSYRRKSIGVAEAIVGLKYGTRRPIVVFMEKSPLSIIVFMGIAYSGNFYVPIDVEAPVQRANKILEVIEAGIVITERSNIEKFKSYNFSGEYIVVEDIAEQEKSERIEEIQRTIIDTDLLYVLFTSGSTGVPKGVSITHRSVIDYIDWVADTFKFTNKDKFANQAPFYFDNSILDIYTTMKTGASLYIIPRKLFSQPVPLLKYLKTNGISTIFWVPSALIVISRLKAFRNVNLDGILKRVLFCGEVMPNAQLNIWRTYLPNTIFVNLYGPTEITDACTYFFVNRPFNDDELLPIGYPMRNTGILVLDENDKEVVEAEQIGELCVKGTCLAKGYYGNKEKTDEMFIQNPLNTKVPEVIYRTGDLVKYNEYHELVYLCRKDFQIKHMGHRIELGEIEVAVMSIEGISTCCCLYDEAKSEIILFIENNISISDINEKLKLMIPLYMLPSKVVVIHKMPLNSNGKIDRVQLREMISGV